MAYATLDDVQRRMPQFTLTETSKPSLETAQIFLDDVIAGFEAAMLNLGYALPITGARSISQAREMVCDGVIARVLFARATATGGEAAMVSADRAQKRYDDALRNLADPKHPAELSDATRTDDELAKPGIAPMGLLTDDDGNAIEPRVTMSEDF